MMPACSRRSRWRWAATRAGDRDANRSTPSCQTDASIGTPQKTAHPVAYDSASPGGSSSPRVAAATLAARPEREPDKR
jgi:hypothetical protein